MIAAGESDGATRLLLLGNFFMNAPLAETLKQQSIDHGVDAMVETGTNNSAGGLDFVGEAGWSAARASMSEGRWAAVFVSPVAGAARRAARGGLGVHGLARPPAAALVWRRSLWLAAAAADRGAPVIVEVPARVAALRPQIGLRALGKDPPAWLRAPGVQISWGGSVTSLTARRPTSSAPRCTAPRFCMISSPQPVWARQWSPCGGRSL